MANVCNLLASPKDQTGPTGQTGEIPRADGPGLSLGRWMMIFLILGTGWRLIRYFLRFPIWGDECFICLNLIDNDYLGLTGPLRCSQVAPILFLWGEMTAFLALGPSALALRLMPLLAGLLALGLFQRLAKRVLAPLPATIAVGMLAVAIWPVSMCTLIKPYSLDLLMATILLLLAVEWLDNPGRSAPLWCLALVIPFAIFSSYASVLVAGSVSLALLPTAWKQESWKSRWAYLSYNLALFAAFAGNYYCVGLAQLDREHGSVNQYLQEYWADGFPPSNPVELLQWLFLTHVGQMFAYPVGGSNGLSTLTTLLFLTGLVALWKSRRYQLVVLFVTPFILWMLAAVLRKYPYGASCRLSQHVAPIVCILAALGTAWVIGQFNSTLWRNRMTWAVFAWFIVVGLAGIEWDLLHPYRGEADVWIGKVVRQIRGLSGPHDQIIVLEKEEEMDSVFRWELQQQRIDGRYLGFEGKVNPEGLETSAAQVWVLTTADDRTGFERVREKLESSGRTWTLAAEVPYQFIPSKKKEPALHCRLVRWVCPGASGLPDPLPPLSVSP